MTDLLPPLSIHHLNMGDTKRFLSDEYHKHQRALNEGFSRYLASSDLLALQAPSALDYIFYSTNLAARFGVGLTGSTVMSVGTGDCGQLGFGSEFCFPAGLMVRRVSNSTTNHPVSDPPLDDEITAVTTRPVPAFHHQPSHAIRLLKSGGLSTAAVDERGVWTWGCNDGDALGREGDENLPTLLRFPTNNVVILSVSLGDAHGSAVSALGELFAWGSFRDKEGKAWFPTPDGESGPDTTANTPQKLPQVTSAHLVSSGANHVAVLDHQGQLYTFGLGEQFQLGRPVIPSMKDFGEKYLVKQIHSSHLTPQRVELPSGGNPSRVLALGCGQYHTLVVLLPHASVWGCGLNQYGQLLPPNPNRPVLLPGQQPRLEDQCVLQLTRIPGLDGLNCCEVGGGEHFSFGRSFLVL